MKLLLSVKKLLNKYNKMLLVGLIAILGVFVLVCSSVFFSGTTRELVVKEPVTLMSEEIYRQEFDIDRNMSIKSFSLRFATYARENQGDLCVTLYSNNQLIENWEIDVAELGDYEYFEFDLTTDFKVKKNDNVYIEIYEIYEGDNAIAIITAEDVENPLYRNNELVDNTAICYKVSYSESIVDFVWNNITQIIIVVISAFFLGYLWKRCQSGKSRDYLLFLLTTVSAIFVLLYFPYICGENAYIYADIGCDTIDQYWPKFLFNLNFLQNIGNNGYSLQWGFGRYINHVESVFLNPFDWIFLFIEPIKALLVSLYLKIMWTGCFAWGYFTKKFQYRESALICAILWTFGGWFIAWGQHYAFASYYAYFTAILFFLELLIDKSKYVVFFPIVLGLLTGGSYYFTYMIGVFCIIYLIITGVIKRWSIKDLLCKIMKLGTAEVIAILLCVTQLYPSLYSFGNSSRTSALDVAEMSLFQPREISYLIAYIGRMLSSNIWGVEQYSGPYNYYEMAIVYASSLAIVAIIYFFCTKSWKKMCGILLGYCVFIMLPIVSKVLQFAENSYRWTFLLNIGMVLLVGVFLDKLRKCVEEKEFSLIQKVLIISNIVIACLVCGIIWISEKNIWGFQADTTALIQVCIVWIILDLLVLMLKITKRKKWERVVPLLLVFVCAEQLFMNYYVVNERREISSYALENGYYNDGTTELVEELEKMDSSLYRLNKTYFSVFYNDAYVQGYNSVSSYSSTNAAALNGFVKNLDIQNLNNHPNYVSIDANDTFVNELLAVKYLIAERDEEVTDDYVEVLAKDNLVLYKDMNALPFGYLYTEQLDVNQYDRLDGTEDKSAALMKGFYSEDIVDGYVKVDLVSEDLDTIADVGREQLKNTKIEDVKFENSTYSAKINNNSGKKAMLCIPLIYDNRWKASLNGMEVKTFNINGGLIGVEIPGGEYTVEITYNTFDYNVLQMVSIISCMGYIIFLVCWIKRQFTNCIFSGNRLNND